MSAPLTYLAQGFLLGLTLGTGCLTTCAWIYGPVLASKRSDWRQGLLSSGRFLSYAAFGLAAGWLGQALADIPLIKHLLLIISYFLLSLYLLATAFIRIKWLKTECPWKRYERYVGHPFVLGLLTGLNICPPFLLALTRSFETGPGNGLILFLGFFLSTTLYLLPIAALSLLSHRTWYRLIGIVASILVAGWSLLTAVRLSYYLLLAYR